MKCEKLSILEIKNKKGKNPIVALTAYTFPLARILDNYCDILLVGDSLGMVLYGMNSTLQVTIDMMINHGKAVTKAINKACVVVDMPFASYFNLENAYRNSARILRETECDAIKIEGGAELAETIYFLTKNGIPVVGHIGLQPQHIKKIGSYKCQGKTEDSFKALLQDAKALSDAGAFAIVLECITDRLAKTITESINIPTIGIGSSVFCDGQILVTDDILNLTDFSPKFVKKFADIKKEITNAVNCYRTDVINRKFPTADHSFS